MTIQNTTARARTITITLSLACLAASACEGAETDEAPPETVRGVRTCELFELTLEGEQLTMRVWNEGGLHDCPDEFLAAVDRTRFGVGGPRWRSVDAIEPAGEGAEAPEPPSAEVPAGLGYEMIFVAELPLAPLAEVEAMLGIEIESVEDIPPAARESMLGGVIVGEGYGVREIQRTQPTRMVHRAGAEVFTLDDGQCRYAMKFYTSVVDPALTGEAAVAELGEKFQHLPEGWSFAVRRFDEDLIIEEADGVAHVTSDEFGNSYDRYACD